MTRPDYDAVVIGGGPAGATAAHELASAGRRTLLVDRLGRIKPCGGAVPPALMREFDIPDSLLVARIGSARIVAPSARHVDMPIDDGYVGMVDRECFDEWLRERAAAAGAQRVRGVYLGHEREADGRLVVRLATGEAGAPQRVTTRFMVGADGAASRVAREMLPKPETVPQVSAYHEIIEAPVTGVPGYHARRCEVHYDGRLSPDFYAWVFPHGDTVSVGVGSARKGFSLRRAVDELRDRAGLSACATIRREGAPIPMRPRRRWDNGRDIVLAGDAAGVVAPASGEGIYYAMLGGRLAAAGCERALAGEGPRALALARARFMRSHRQVFFALGMMQRFWYANDWRRERFVRICADRDVQRLTWESYMNKVLVKSDPLAHTRIFFKNIAHLSGLAPS